jgi:hypothetical protein
MEGLNLPAQQRRAAETHHTAPETRTKMPRKRTAEDMEDSAGERRATEELWEMLQAMNPFLPKM